MVQHKRIPGPFFEPEIPTGQSRKVLYKNSSLYPVSLDSAPFSSHRTAADILSQRLACGCVQAIMADNVFAVSTEQQERERLLGVLMPGAADSFFPSTNVTTVNQQPHHQSHFSPTIPPHVNLRQALGVGGVMTPMAYDPRAAPARDVAAVQFQVVRNTYKSCDFCAKRKRRCDGDGINRCRLVCFVIIVDDA